MVPHAPGMTVGNPPTRRVKVPGGWLYQVAEMGWTSSGGGYVVSWLLPVFVPESA